MDPLRAAEARPLNRKLTPRTGTLLLILVALVLPTWGTAAAPAHTDAAPTAADLTRVPTLPGALTVTQSGDDVDVTRAHQSLRDAVAANVDARDPRTFPAAARALVDLTGGIETAGFVRAEAAAAGVRDNVVRIPYAVGDLTGDGLDDVLVAGLDGETGALLDLRAVRGTDGARVWTASAGDAYDLLPLAVGDLTGDGLDDVVFLSLTVEGAGVYECTPDVFICADVLGVRYAWDLRLISGADGATAWSRTYAGAAAVAGGSALTGVGAQPATTVYAGGLAVLLPTSVNFLVVPAVAGDLDGDGTPDLVVNSLDLTQTFGNTGATAVPEGRVAGHGGELLLTTRAEVVSGADGAARLVRVQPHTPGEAYLVPAGDAVGDGTRDLLWSAYATNFGQGACATAARAGTNACAATPRPFVTTAEMLDGATLRTAWVTQRTYDSARTMVPFALEGDVDGDGAHDAMLLTLFDNAQETVVLSGATGDALWARQDAASLPVVAGAIGGTPGDDFLVLTFDVARGEAGVVRVDGATGEELFATHHPLPRHDGPFYRQTALGVGADSDGDGIRDAIVGGYAVRFPTGETTSLVHVESGARPHAVYAHTSDVMEVPVTTLDLDGDGAHDLVTATFTFEGWTTHLTVNGIRMADGVAAWHHPRTHTGFFAWSVTPTGDQSGAGGDDLLYLEVVYHPEGYASPVTSLDGRTGDPMWTLGT